ncbi:MAG: hypothetical protein RI897_1664 [Verrucomicrobiota bacterium]
MGPKLREAAVDGNMGDGRWEMGDRMLVKGSRFEVGVRVWRDVEARVEAGGYGRVDALQSAVLRPAHAQA